MSAEPIGKMPFPGVACPETRNRPYRRCWKDRRPKLALGPCNGTPIRRMWQLPLEIQNGNPVKLKSEIP
jgi:hypothetical protein